MSITRVDIKTSLDLAAKFSPKPFVVDDATVEFYLIQLIGVTADRFTTAMNYFIGQRIVPTPTEILQYDPSRDTGEWFDILAVASGQSKEAEISGISLHALLTVTSCSTQIAALNKLRAASSFETSEYRRDWIKAISMPLDPKTIAPAAATISLAPPGAVVKVDSENTPDLNHTHQCNAMLRCLAQRAISDETALRLSREFQALARQKVIDFLSFPKEMRGCIFKFICSSDEAPAKIEEHLLLVPEKHREKAWDYASTHKFAVNPRVPASR